jgi:hypothetical protein
MVQILPERKHLQFLDLRTSLAKMLACRPNLTRSISGKRFPVSPIAELKSFGLQIGRWGVILILAQAGGAAGHRQMGSVD